MAVVQLNKRQKEVLQTFLDDEKDVLALIKQNYHDALNEVNIRIDQLMNRDDADLSNVVYQISYQKALQSQIQGIMSDLHGKEFNTISEYLVKSYENGYIGSMYDIHGQGIPIIVPIDQKNVVRAITHDTKLSSDLYTSLGKDINKLSRQISAEISRGFSTAMTYQDIARNISDKAKIPQNRAMTIARTEAHRIQSESSLDAQRAAVNAGADVKKQWDAFLDGLTREAHQKLDGQIRDVEEAFEVDGYEAMFPGGFGVAEIDINCRCALLQRASWALDQAELGILKERAAYFGLDKTESFEEFKEKYMRYTGAHYGAYNDINDPKGSKRQAHAELFYEELRNSDKETIVNSIASNTGIDSERVAKMYDHILVNEYDLDEEKTRFFPDYDMAQSLQRLRNGVGIQDHDIILVLHESLEYDYMNIDGLGYEEAHKKTNIKYDYHTALLKWLDE